MSEMSTTLITLAPDAVPEALRAWLQEAGNRALLASLELMDDGSLAILGLPEVDPSLVARVSRTMAQHEDVLRRLS